MALLSGQSGKGKSTIVQGVYFALFGVGNKITSFGKTSCKVELEFDGMKITRSKNPGKLVVNEIYEDDAAQDMINKKFGATFDVTGYIPQNAIKSFVLMNPQDKLAFLERFAFDDVNLSGIKTRCKDQISRKHEELIAISSKLEVVTELVDNAEEPEMVEFPLKVKNNDYEKSIRNEEIRLKNTYTLIQRATSDLSTLIKERQDITLCLSKINTSYLEIDELEVALLTTKDKLDSVKDEMTDEQIKKLENELNYIIRNRELLSALRQFDKDTETLDTMIRECISDMTNELSTISTGLWEEYSKEDIRESIESTEILLTDSERLSMLRSRYARYGNDMSIAELKTKIINNQELILQADVHICPSCNASLRFTDNALVRDDIIVMGDIKIDKDLLLLEITKFDKIIKILSDMDDITNSYEDEIPDVDSIKSNLVYLRQYEFTNTRNEDRTHTLEASIKNNDTNQTCKQLSMKLEHAKHRIRKLKEQTSEVFTSTMTEDDIRSTIELEKINNIIRSESIHRSEEIRIKIKSYHNSICLLLDQHVNTHKRTGDITSHTSVIDMKIKALTDELIMLETKRTTCENNLKEVDRWKRMKEELVKYTELQSRVASIQEDETDKRNQYAALTTLRENIIEAESISMMNVVESINTHARVYLESFFENDPILVTLQAFKQTKKVTKAQINMEIEYKGMECDLYMMSGGEMSRIILAYTLALAEMFNTPLLLLDECTASLDQETADHVFESIRENFNGKLTLIIAHQVVTGTFDRTICLDKN